jgi:hypothetical protein
LAKRCLSEAEIAMVRRWARLRRRVFWWLLPLFVATGALMLLIAAASLLDHQWFVGGALLFCTVPLVALGWTMWNSARVYRQVRASTEVSTLRGILRWRFQAPSGDYFVGETCVVFASRQLRQSARLDEPCEADVLFETAPPLLIAIRQRSKGS